MPWKTIQRYGEKTWETRAGVACTISLIFGSETRKSNFNFYLCLRYLLPMGVPWPPPPRGSPGMPGVPPRFPPRVPWPPPGVPPGAPKAPRVPWPPPRGSPGIPGLPGRFLGSTWYMKSRILVAGLGSPRTGRWGWGPLEGPATAGQVGTGASWRPFLGVP